MRFDFLVSQFINLVSGSKLPVSSGLEPSKHVGVADYSDAKGRLVKLIDTPGLDVKSGDDILKEIMAACPPVKRWVCPCIWEISGFESNSAGGKQSMA